MQGRFDNHLGLTGNAIAVKIYLDKKKKGTPDDWKPQYLIDNDSWMAPYFDQADSSARYLRRVYFAGPMAQ
ncbi:MAG TPA: hypothetical protein VII90_00220 [Anaerolineales bacterium]